MIELTIGSLLSGNYEDPGDLYQLYVIRDHESDLIFYVGQSCAGVTDRVLQHLGKSRRFPTEDSVTRLVYEAMPRSLAWKVQFYRQDEVLPEYMAKVVKGMTKEKWEAGFRAMGVNLPWHEEDGQDRVWYNDLDKAEEMLIEKLRPCLNVTHNANRRKLPPEYSFWL